MTMQKLRSYPRCGGHARQAVLNQDARTSDELIKLVEEVITRVKPQGRLGNKIYQTILAIDSELNMASDEQYRQLLVKAAYALRNLEEDIQKRLLPSLLGCID